MQEGDDGMVPGGPDVAHGQQPWCLSSRPGQGRSSQVPALRGLAEGK